MSLSINPETTKAILVGISDYQYLPEIRPARTVISDLKKSLMNPNILGLSEKHIITVLDKKNDEIEEVIEDFFDIDSGNQDIETLLFYYVGHGHRYKNDAFCLTGTNSKGSRKSSLLPFDDIKERFEESNLQQRIIILDACYSGEAAMSADFIEDWDVKGSYILTSADRNQKSYFNTAEDTQYTYFSKRFLEILNSGVTNNKGFIDLDSLYNGLRNYHEKCTPQIKSTLKNINSGEFHLFKNAQFDPFEIRMKEGQAFLDKLEFEKAEAKFIKATRTKGINEKQRHRAETKIQECERGLKLYTEIQQKINRQAITIKRKTERELKQKQGQKETELKNEVQNFIESQKGEWNTLEWLDFKEYIYRKLCEYDERRIAELLESRKSNFQKTLKPSIIETIVGNYIFVKGGTFLMGSPENEVDREKIETQHEVKLSDFYIGETTITQGQWTTVMGNNPSSFKNGDNYPVETVSWEDAQDFIKKINDKFKSQYIFRLPTEAQWEYACRAGTTTPFNTGENLTTKQGNYDGNNPYNENPKGDYLKQTTPVSKYAPNTLGLFDMHGNVWEWCEDSYQDWYYDWCKKQGIIENPICNNDGEEKDKVLCGGSWDDIARDCRSANRINITPDYRSNYVGFRLVCSPAHKI